MADHKVVTNSDFSRVRTLFTGPESACRQFIERNFPRFHVEPPNQDPGVPDVKLVSSDGVEDTYHADEGWASAKPAAPADATAKPDGPVLA